MTPDLLVVIVTYNSAAVVPDLLDSLPAGLSGLRAEVVVVDNGSVDGTADLLERRADCRVVRSRNEGYSAGINRGVAAGGPAPAVLVLNPDIRLLPGSVPPLLRRLVEHPRVGIVAPRIRTAAGDLDLTLRREPAVLRAIGLNRTGRPAFSEYLVHPHEYEHEREVDWAVGAALLVRRTCHDDLGGWDESFFLYSEETDFCLRAGDRGWTTRYVPEAEVVHLAGASGRTSTTHVMQIVNRVRLYRRRNGTARGWLYWGVTLFSELSWAARGHRPSRAAVRALLRPSTRPAQLGCSSHLLPGGPPRFAPAAARDGARRAVGERS